MYKTRNGFLLDHILWLIKPGKLKTDCSTFKRLNLSNPIFKGIIVYYCHKQRRLRKLNPILQNSETFIKQEKHRLLVYFVFYCESSHSLHGLSNLNTPHRAVACCKKKTVNCSVRRFWNNGR